MSSMDTTPGSASILSINEDSVSSTITKTGGSASKKHHQQNFSQSTPQRLTIATVNTTTATTTATSTAIVDDERDKTSFYRDLYHFHETKG